MTFNVTGDSAPGTDGNAALAFKTMSPVDMRTAAAQFRQDARRVLHRGTMAALLIMADELVALAATIEQRQGRKAAKLTDC